ncbi:MAG: MarR family transcriptional regulator [Actinobacteria bacterium]|jgi:DNA-binding MarR family transcriptional regulator|nr:MarR family transcriptional regulator [Actinomycetota bacterium]
MTERDRLKQEIGAVWLRLLAVSLPEQTSSLLDYELTIQQIRAFAFIFAQQETPVSRVAEALDIRPNVATGITQRLVDRGLIDRRENPDDRRIRLLTPTDAGHALVDELGGIVLAKGMKLLDGLSDERLRQLRDFFAAIEPLQED